MSVSPQPVPIRDALAPVGAVTFAFTDIEGSTGRWERDPVAMKAALRKHDVVMRATIAEYRGYVFKTVGDAFCSVFSEPHAAVAAMIAAQNALAAEDFSAVAGLPVRAALHSGVADERDGDYFGPVVNRVARLVAIAHGGQVLISGTTRDLTQASLPARATLRDLGEHRLKDLARPEHVYQLVAPGLVQHFPPLRSLNALYHNLPLQLTSFVGREDEVREVTALLGSHRLVSIVGSGGVGKTRASLAIAANMLDGSGDGVWFIELAPLASGDYLPTTVAQAMGLTLRDEGDPLDSLLGALKSKRALLIFDNCEHIIESAARVIGALLRICPQIAILTSTRRSLAISGEVTYRMPSLAIPDAASRLTATDAARFPAMILFAERAAGVDHRFALTDDNASIIGEICRRLDGIPLAIELAAARVKVLTPRQLREGLDDRFRVLSGKHRDRLPRQQTLRALIDWSYDLLDDCERALFRRLCIFLGGFALEGARAVGGAESPDGLDVFETLTSLVDQSLVLAEPHGEAQRFRMLESTQAYGREKLAATGEETACRTRHLYYLRNLFAAAMARARQSGSSKEIESLLIAELDDVRFALDEVAARGERTIGAQLLAAIDSRWHWVGLGSEGASRIERFIALLPPGEERLSSLLWTALARIFRDTKPVQALLAARAAVQHGRAAKDPDVLAEALVSLASQLARAHNFEEAAAIVDEAEQLVPAENTWLRLRILNTRAHLGYFMGDLAAAEHAYAVLEKTYSQLGNVSAANTAARSIAEVQFQRGEAEQAVSTITRQLAELRAGHDRASLLAAFANICGYLIASDRLAQARAIAREALEASTESDRDVMPMTCLIEHVALWIALAGDVRRSAELAGYTEVAFSRIGYCREYTERVTRLRLEKMLDERLAPTERASSFARGAALSPEAAIALASGCFETGHA